MTLAKGLTGAHLPLGAVLVSAPEGVSFAARGNLIILAPPLVIEEPDLDRAMLLLDRLLTELELP